jgi:hypothetical protein
MEIDLQISGVRVLQIGRQDGHEKNVDKETL